MNETDDTQPPVPDDTTPATPDGQPTGAPERQPAPAADAGAPDQPTRAYAPPGASAGPQYPPPGGYQAPPSSAPPGGYQAAGSYIPPGGYQAPSSAPRQAVRLTRSRSDRVIGGVCGGLARFWNTDATLLRVLTVVLTLATGGALLIGYLIAWIAIPDEPSGPNARFGSPADPVGYASGGNPAYADYTTEYVPPTPRERSYLGWLVLSAAVLAAGVLGLIGFLVPADVGIWGVILGVSLAILGVGLLIGTKFGRARWLLWLAVPLAFVTFATVQAGNFVRDNPDWDRWTASTRADGWGGLSIGDRTWTVQPEDVAESPLEYRLSAGSAVLDLTELAGIEAEESADPAQPLRIDAGVGVGELLIRVPADVEVDFTGRVNFGQITVPGKGTTDGTDVDVQTTISPLAGTESAYSVTIDAAIGAGSLEVRREAA